MCIFVGCHTEILIVFEKNHLIMAKPWQSLAFALTPGYT